MKRRAAKVFVAVILCTFLAVGGCGVLDAVRVRNAVAAAESDIIDWRYTVIGGYVYRRLYNYSREEWIGEWEKC